MQIRCECRRTGNIRFVRSSIVVCLQQRPQRLHSRVHVKPQAKFMSLHRKRGRKCGRKPFKRILRRSKVGFLWSEPDAPWDDKLLKRDTVAMRQEICSTKPVYHTTWKYFAQLRDMTCNTAPMFYNALGFEPHPALEVSCMNLYFGRITR